MQQNPWKIHLKETVYESAWLKIFRCEVTNPAGNPGVYSTIHYKNKAIGILPLDAQYNTWLVGQWRFPLECYSWEIPEGGGHPDTPYQESAARELMEETGLKAAELKEFMRLHTSNSASDEEAIVFLATGLSEGEADPEETEVLQVKKLPLKDAYQMVLNGEITDAISVAAIQKAYHHVLPASHK